METMDAPWLNKSNLEQWLKTPVLDLSLKDTKLKGDNYMSNINRLEVKTENGDRSLIVKYCLENAEELGDTTIFKKEEEMYGNTLPRMDEILRKAKQGDLESLAPKCLHSYKDFLVMEDLCAEGYKMMDRCRGMDLEQCLTVMRTIARFHAASVVLHEQDPQSMKEYESSLFSEPNLIKALITYLQTMTKMLIEELETWSAEQWWPYVEKLRHIQDDFAERLMKVCCRNDSEFNVLIHGDLWTNNILFRGDVAKLIDFQMSCFTSPGIDLILFLTTSPSMEVRIKYFHSLIQEYQVTLCRTLTALGSKKSLTLEEVYHIYSSKAFYGLFGIISEAAAMTSDPNCGFSLGEAMKGKTPGRQMYSEFFKKLVTWEFPILDRMGAFDYK